MNDIIKELNEELIKFQTGVLEVLALNRKQQNKLSDLIFERLENMDKALKLIEIENSLNDKELDQC